MVISLGLHDHCRWTTRALPLIFRAPKPLPLGARHHFPWTTYPASYRRAQGRGGRSITVGLHNIALGLHNITVGLHTSRISRAKLTTYTKGQGA